MSCPICGKPAGVWRDRARARRYCTDHTGGKGKRPQRPGAGRSLPPPAPGEARPFDLDPLEVLLGRPGATRLAERLEIHYRQLFRLRASGLTDGQADELACRVGLHPAVVRPGW